MSSRTGLTQYALMNVIASVLYSIIFCTLNINSKIINETSILFKVALIIAAHELLLCKNPFVRLRLYNVTTVCENQTDFHKVVLLR